MHMASVLGAPEYLGYRPLVHAKSVDFVRRVGPDGRLLMVVVKFLDRSLESWVTTTHPMNYSDLTRRLRAHTMQSVGGES